MNEIIPNLWIGDWHAARDRHRQFTKVVCVACDGYATNAAPNSAVFALADGPGNACALLTEAVNVVIQSAQSGEKTLVHGVSGKSRSALVCMLAVMRLSGLPESEAYQTVKNARDEIGIHPSLIRLAIEAGLLKPSKRIKV